VTATTPEQAAAIGARDRDVFCEAGAGSGKTRVLVGRYCDAVCDDGVGIDEILAFTFTERAAAELRQRIRSELNARSRAARAAGDAPRAAELQGFARETERAWVTTIHGFCRRLLGTHPIAAGLDPRFRVLDEPEAGRLREQAAREAIRELVAAEDERVTRVIAAYRAYRIADIVLAAHERLRSQGMAAPSLPEVGLPRRSQKDDDSELSPDEAQAALDARAVLQEVLIAVSTRYEELKSARSGLDFGDLELSAVELLRSSPAVAELWRGRFRHLMVDEFQDTNRVQLELIDRLRGPDTRLFTVGDEHQSIYRFRNADLEVFREERRRAERSESTEVLPLRGNFRARPEVLAAANELGGILLDGFTPLTSGRDSAGDGPRAELLLTFEEGRGKDHRKWKADGIDLEPPPSEGNRATVAQARGLAERLRALVDAGEAEPGDIVVLLRAFTHVDAYEEALRRFGLEPYVVGGRGYWSQQQVEDLLRLLAVVANPLDDEMLFGALASPACEVSPDALWLLRHAVGEGRHVWPAVEAAFGTGEREADLEDPEKLEAIAADDAARLRNFCATVAELRAEAPVTPLDALVERTMNAYRYDLALLAKPQGEGRMANVRKLMRLAAEFERNEGRDLRAFLAQANESTRRDEREGQAPVQAEDYPGVRIMTVHGAKGLEFPVVAVPDLDRALDAGHRSGDIWIGRLDPEGGQARFGLRLAFPTAASFGVWELTELDAEEKAAEAEESCRLVYVAATRARERLILCGVFKPAHLEPPGERKPNDPALRRVLPELVRRGWAGGDGSIELPLPEPADAAGAGGVAELRISVSEPGPERAAALRRTLPPRAAAPAEGVHAPPPILPQGPSPVPLGHLSYSALDAFKRCGYRFYVERVLGVRGGAVVAAAPAGSALDAGDEEPDADDTELREPDAGAATPSAAKALGNAVHAALEWSARANWERPGADRIAALLAREGVTGDESTERAARLIDGWLESDLCARLEGLRLRPEAPFVLPVAGTVLRGNMDLLGIGEGERLVVDYKTDRVGSLDTAALGERYAAQRAVYALAAAGDADRILAAHVFLERPGEPVVEEFDRQRLRAAEGRLETLVAQIRSGLFEPAAAPYGALCFGCPAAPRLCPRPAWRPARDAPAAVR
jgi:ATP-dependent exoDNAse (exonuclease V) beta subunit